MIRPFRAETLRYGHSRWPASSSTTIPFQWAASARAGPAPRRRPYSDDWHRMHLNNPRDVVPGVQHAGLSVAGPNAGRSGRHGAEDAALRTVGVPYSDDDIDGAGRRGQVGQDRAGRGDRLPAGLGPLLGNTAAKARRSPWTINDARRGDVRSSPVAFIGIVVWAWSAATGFDEPRICRRCDNRAAEAERGTTR